MAGLLDLLMSAMQAAGGKGDRLRDPASNRVAQAFDAASGGPQGGLSPDQALAYAKSVNPAMRAPETPQQADPWQGLRDVTPGAGVDPMQTASAGPAPGDSNLAWQRGMGSSEGPPAPQGGPGGGGSLNWRELLRALGPALMMADPLGRNQGMAAMMMRQSDERRKGAKDAQNQNATKQWLLSQGMDEGTAAMMVSDPVLLRQWFGERNKKPEQTDFDQRAAAARAYGLDPNTPEGRNFILSGDLPGTARGDSKPASIAEFEYGQTNPDYAEWMKTKGRDAPLTATDKKAILEADEMVLSNQNTIDMLDSVLVEPSGPGSSLNDRAGYGATARTQSWLARNDPTGFFNDAKGEATTELENVVLNQALSNLKAIFGAAPTEGERKILVDLQASVDKTPQERKLIIERAKELAGKRLQFNQERANSLRSNEFYRPGTGSPRQQAAPSVGAPAAAASSADGWTDAGNGVRIRRKQ